jgi:hypothetical protein
LREAEFFEPFDCAVEFPEPLRVEYDLSLEGFVEDAEIDKLVACFAAVSVRSQAAGAARGDRSQR